MVKGKIFTNCLLVISIILTTVSFFSCSTDDELSYLIDERVPLETEVSPSPVYPIDSIDINTTTQGNKTMTLLICAENSHVTDTIE